MRRAMMVKVSGGGGGGGSFKTLTIDHTKCGTADSTDYPLLVKGTYSYLANVANGGNLNSVNNLAFFSDSGLTTLLTFERVRHDLTTGAVVYYVKIPTLSHSADTVIYMAWDTANSTDRSDAANTWNANYKTVIHTGDGSTLNLTDSTSNAQNFTNNGSVAAAAGTIYGAANIAGASQQYLSSNVAAVTGYPLSFSALVKLNSSLASGEDRIILTVAKSSALEEFWLGYVNIVGTGDRLRCVAQGASGTENEVRVTATIDTNVHHVACTFVNTTAFAVYQDGALLSTTQLNGNLVTPTGLDHTYIGGLIYNTSNFYGQMKGLVEEPRIANVARAASWWAAEANNLLSPSTFYTLT